MASNDQEANSGQITQSGNLANVEVALALTAGKSRNVVIPNRTFIAYKGYVKVIPPNCTYGNGQLATPGQPITTYQFSEDANCTGLVSICSTTGTGLFSPQPYPYTTCFKTCRAPDGSTLGHNASRTFYRVSSANSCSSESTSIHCNNGNIDSGNTSYTLTSCTDNPKVDCVWHYSECKPYFITGKPVGGNGNSGQTVSGYKTIVIDSQPLNGGGSVSNKYKPKIQLSLHCSSRTASRG